MGTLYIVATPIGNLEDITVRAIKALATADIIACEDTRRTGLLLSSLKTWYPWYFEKATSPQLVSYYDEIELSKAPMLIGKLQNDQSVVLVSDSGTPLISDPGFKLVSMALKRQIPVISIPGPTALINALVVSGFPPNKFLFIGFIEKKENAKNIQLEHLVSMQKQTGKGLTVISYEVTERLSETLEILKEFAGDIEIAVVREMTKLHEEVLRGTISTVLPSIAQIKGEIVLVFHLS